ncbi:MAG TPA: hypothetical protein VM555_09425 [Tahibacter sp.]|nr:hypothetical protein [Tahibacter sp.]
MRERRFSLFVSTLLELTATSSAADETRPLVLATHPKYDRTACDTLNADAPAARDVLDRALGQPAKPQTSAWRQQRPLMPRSNPPSHPMRPPTYVGGPAARALRVQRRHGTTSGMTTGTAAIRRRTGTTIAFRTTRDRAAHICRSATSRA